MCPGGGVAWLFYYVLGSSKSGDHPLYIGTSLYIGRLASYICYRYSTYSLLHNARTPWDYLPLHTKHPQSIESAATFPR